MRYKLIVIVAAMGLVFASGAAAATWSSPVNLSADGQDARFPQVAGSADGSKLTSVWEQWGSGNSIIQASTSTDYGATWSNPFDLSDPGQDARDPQVTCSADGSKLIAVWSRYNGSKWIIQFRTNTSGSAWSPSPINLFADGQDAREPRVTCSADGSALAVVWSDGNDSNWIIQASTSPDYGASWSSPSMCPPAGRTSARVTR